jgi:tripartite-type tricarboxylate transporter receptor subunit TctC
MKKKGVLFLLALFLLMTGICIPVAANGGAEDTMEETMVQEEPYPNKPITAVAPFGAGGGTDRAVRAMATVWGQYSDVPLRVVNMPGAGSAEGMKFVHDAKPDGYTIVQNGSQMLTLPYFYTKQEIGWTLEDFEPIAVQQIIVYMLVVPKNSPFNTLNDMIEWAKANPGQLNHGVVGWGGDSHVAFKALELEAGFKATAVPFDSGADQVANIAGGHIDAAVATFGTMLPLAQSGDAKVLAVGAEERNPALPDAPTALEQGVDWTFPNWRGWLAPPGTPRDRVEYLAGIMEKALDEATLQKAITDRGEVPKYIGLEDFEAYLDRVDKILRPAIDAIQAEQQ